jgi:hypothetical protein
MSGKLKKRLLAAVVALGIWAGGSVRAEPLVTHPAASATTAQGWNRQMGKFGESLVREVHRARGLEVFNLNVGEHGIDGLVRATGSDGRVAFRVIEIKTLQHGTDFRLGQTRAGRQLSASWIEDRLAKAASLHGEAEVKKAASQALEQFRKAPASIPVELHGVSVCDNRYVVKLVAPATGAFKGEAVNCKVTGVWEELAQKARGKDVRQAAARHLAEYHRLREAVKPRVVQGARLARKLAEAAGVEEKQLGKALKEASEHIRVPGQSRWVKVGGKMFKFAGKAAGPAGVVIGVVVYTAEAAEIEQKVERGELTREQADAQQVKLAVRTTSAGGGALAGAAGGAAIGTFLCPGPGNVVGGIVGAVAGCVGADLVMAATGLTDALGEFLAPGVEATRRACSYIKEQGIAVTIAAREQLREWVGPEVYDQTVAALDSAATWVGETARQVGTAVADGAIYLKDRTVDGAKQVGGAVADAASWTWGAVRSGWGRLRW